MDDELSLQDFAADQSFSTVVNTISNSRLVDYSFPSTSFDTALPPVSVDGYIDALLLPWRQSLPPEASSNVECKIPEVFFRTDSNGFVGRLSFFQLPLNEFASSRQLDAYHDEMCEHLDSCENLILQSIGVNDIDKVDSCCDQTKSLTVSISHACETAYRPSSRSKGIFG